MKIEKVWALWFSATGTTARVVNALTLDLGQRLEVPVHPFCFTLPDSRRGDLTFGPRDLVVIGLPVYAGRLPNLILPWLQSGLQGQNTPAVPVVLYGNRDVDDGLIELRDVLAQNGFCPLAAGAFVGQHAFSHTLGAGRPDGQDMAMVRELALRTADKVRRLDAPPAQPVAVPGCTPLRPYYMPRDRQGQPIRDFVKAKPATDSALCTRCGLCARVCPMGAIDPDDPALVPGKCIKCNACIRTCPAGARIFDHPGYVYHKQELEALYGARRAESRVFW